jgi:molecular chaperone GrpE
MEPTIKNEEGETEAADSKIEQLKEEVRREHNLYLRALADFDNYRRRVERESASAALSGKREIITSLLEVLDGFDRALRHIGGKPSPMSEGLQALHRKLLGLLEAQGVTPIESLGDTFDPELHEAVGTVETDEYESGRVADEVQRGYRWNDKVLRPARVRVAQ